MKIDKIEICNLASLEGEQIVDFTVEPLRSAGLFAITGNTGAGKSTLLDAVCIALYGKAPRFENSERQKKFGIAADDSQKELGSGDVRNILRRGQTEGYSKVTFSLPDGSVYEATWSVRVKRTGTYDAAKRTLKCLRPQKTEYDPSEVNQRVTRLIGLTYDQFTRTVILAQNSFANFLNAKQSEKSLLLETLTGTELYGNISTMVFEETREAQKRYDGIVEKINGIATCRLDDDRLAKTKEQLTMNEGQLKLASSALGRIDKQLKWYDNYHKARAEEENQKKLLFEAQREYNSLYDQRQTLERYEKVQTFQGLYHTIKETESEIGKLKTQATLKQQELTKEKARQAEAQRQYNTALTRLEDAKNAYNQKMPQFNKGHDLLGQIAAIGKEMSEKRETLTQYEDNVAKQTEKLVAQEAARDENARKKERVMQHLQAIAIHRNLIEHVELAKVTLGQMHDITVDLTRTEKALADSRNQLKQEEELQAKLAEEQTRLETKEKTLKDELFIHNQANRGLSSVEIQKLMNRYSDTHRRSKSAAELWRRIADGYSEIEEQEDEIRRREIAVEQIRKDINTRAIHVNALNEALEVLRSSYMLSQSENIIELRRNLKEGSACPVCGATHHPYHSETEQELGRILSTLEKDFKAAEAAYNAANDTLIEKKRRLSEESGRLIQVRAELERTRKRQEADVKLWRDVEDLDAALAGCSPSISRENRKMLIRQLFENSERELAKQQQILDNFNAHQEAINDINEKLRDMNEKRSDCVRRVSEAAANARLLDEKIAELQQQLSHMGDDLTAKTGKMDGLITLPLWKEEWQKSHEAFVQRIAALADDWAEYNAELNKDNQYEFQLQEDINALIGWLDSNKNHCTNLRDDINRKQEVVDNMRQELRRMFGDCSLQEVMTQMHDSIDRNAREEQRSRTALDQADSTLKMREGEIANLEAQQRRREEDLRQLRSELDIRISRFNNDNSTLQYFELDKLFSDPRDWNRLRMVINQSREKLQRISINEETASKELLRLQQDADRPGESVDDSELNLQKEKERHEERIEEVRHRISEAQALIAMHQKSVEQAGALEPERLRLKEESDNWKKLNSIIGSADGKLFREIAQCYTFGVLVGYANRHLKDLSTRYRLRNKPGTLTLEIIDRDMLDQTRGVNSLSGGETFIVSLALALGLSSLRSQGTQISSLFIDEGFGNLDAASLDLVIDALSALQSTQGRKVGVISHTNQIRGRISPQIRLVKLAMNGKSRIEIR